jgi:antitoxin component YwqK of YwqJK toxin-antitoxin module
MKNWICNLALLLLLFINSGGLLAQSDTGIYADLIPFHKINDGWHSAGPDAIFYRYCENGLCEGELSYYYDSGALKQQAFYKDGRIYGRYCSYYESGQIKDSGVRYNARSVGFSKYFYENGLVRWESYHDSLSKTMWSKEYYETGNLEASKAVDENGDLIYVFDFEENQDTFYAIQRIDSVNLVYSYFIKFDNGNIEHEGFFCYHPKRKKKQVGTWKYYNEEGELTSIEEYTPLNELNFDE